MPPRAKIKAIEETYNRTVHTDVDPPVKEWYDAEEYHQKYIEKQMARSWI